MWVGQAPWELCPPPPGGAPRCLREKEGWANHGEQASKQHSSELYALVPAFRFLPWDPNLPLPDYGIWPESQVNQFLPPVPKSHPPKKTWLWNLIMMAMTHLICKYCSFPWNKINEGFCLPPIVFLRANISTNTIHFEKWICEMNIWDIVSLDSSSSNAKRDICFQAVCFVPQFKMISLFKEGFIKHPNLIVK